MAAQAPQPTLSGRTEQQTLATKCATRKLTAVAHRLHHRPFCSWLRREESNLQFLLNRQARYHFATPHSFDLVTSEPVPGLAPGFRTYKIRASLQCLTGL